MFGLDRRPPLLGHLEQRALLPLPLPLIRLRAHHTRHGPLIIQILGGFDLQRLFRQGLHDLKGQEAQDIDDVIVGFGVGDDPEAGPFAEPLAFAEGEGRLAAVGPENVFVLGHVLGALVGGGEAGEGCGGLFGFVFALVGVVFVFALRYLFGVKGGYVPGEADAGFFASGVGRLLGRRVGRTGLCCRKGLGMKMHVSYRVEEVTFLVGIKANGVKTAEEHMRR